MMAGKRLRAVPDPEPTVSAEDLAGWPLFERIRHVRGELGLLQREFAAEVGVETRTVKGWESPRMERGAPSWENAVRIAELAGGVYPPELFCAPAPLEETIAQEILDAIRAVERRLAAIERRLK